MQATSLQDAASPTATALPSGATARPLTVADAGSGSAAPQGALADGLVFVTGSRRPATRR